MLEEFSASHAYRQQDQSSLIEEYTFKDIPRVAAATPNELWMNKTVSHTLQYPFVNVFNQYLIQYQTSENKNWQSLDISVRRLLIQYQSHPYSFAFRQQAAAEMLLDSRVALLEYQDKQAQQAIAFYTEQLAQGGSTATALMYFSLKKLKGYWSERKISSMAKRALKRAETNLSYIYLLNRFRQVLTPDKLFPNASFSLLTKYLALEAFGQSQLQKMASIAKVRQVW